MNKELKILIADDHPIIREGLKMVLESKINSVICTQASDGEEAYNLIKNGQFDIATLDVEMPLLNGLDLAKKIIAENIKTKIVFLTMYREEDMFNRALDIGAIGYVLKDNAVVDIVNCIKEVSKNNYYISPSISHLLLNRQKQKKNLFSQNPELELLTKSERKILRLIAGDKTSREIAEELYISVKTVENHRTNISRKLGLHGSHSLVKFAFQSKSIL